MGTISIPDIGLGTYENTDPEQCRSVVAEALETGYRHVDTASAYDNESIVGDGIHDAAVPREEVTVATKVWHGELDYGKLTRSVERSLDRMGLSTLDLVYVHWPATAYDAPQTFAALDKLRDDGLIEGIGVANFTVELLEDARDYCENGIDVLQVEIHPLLQQRELCEYARQHDIEVVAHTPLLGGAVDEVPELQEIADGRDATPAQVALAWLRSRDIATIPGTTDLEHLEENFASTDVELDAEDVETIESIDRTRRVVDPYFAPW